MASNPYHNLAKLGRISLPNLGTYALIDYNGRELIAPVFSRDATYEPGDYVVYEDNLYVFNVAHAEGAAWNANKVTNVTVGSELKELKNAVIGGVHYRGKTTTALFEGSPVNPIKINGNDYTAVAGDLVEVNLAVIGDAYQANVAYNRNDYIRHQSGIDTFTTYRVKQDVTAEENTGWSAMQAFVDLGKPEYIFDGEVWNEVGSYEGFGSLAYKDQAQGTYVAPTGTGSVTVKEYDGTLTKLVTTSIVGTNGTENVSKMTAGTAKDIAKAGTAVVYGTANVGAAVTYGTANRAAEATRYGTANVGTAVTYGNADVGAEATIGNANVGTAVTVATAGTEVVYGKADVGTAVTYGNANVGAAVTVATRKDSTIPVAHSGIVISSVSGDLLTFGDATVTNEYTVGGTASIAPAVQSNTTLTPAVAAPSTQKIRPVGGTTSITPAVTSTTKIHGAVASDKTLTPAVAAPSTQTIYGAVTSTSTLTPAVAAPSSQTIVPAVENGTITPWTESAKTVAKVASSAITVATGSISPSGTGSSVMIGLNPQNVTKDVTVDVDSNAVVTVK